VSAQRDRALARLAAARGLVMRVSNQLDETIEMFLIPEEDARGHARVDLFEGAIEDAGRLSRVLESAQAAFETMDDPAEPAPEEVDDEEDEDAKETARVAEDRPARSARTK
jgi:hypothetical protein